MPSAIFGSRQLVSAVEDVAVEQRRRDGKSEVMLCGKQGHLVYTAMSVKKKSRRNYVTKFFGWNYGSCWMEISTSADGSTKAFLGDFDWEASSTLVIFICTLRSFTDHHLQYCNLSTIKLMYIPSSVSA